jgi:hypothetical protein
MRDTFSRSVQELRRLMLQLTHAPSRRREIKMRLVAARLVFAAVSSSASAQASSKSYWFLSKDDGRTWCGYSDMTEFESEADNLKPNESARVTYSSGKLTELTYQVESESGDWIVIDTYTPLHNEMLLRRANLLTGKSASHSKCRYPCR